jgi:hypothetical protein
MSTPRIAQATFGELEMRVRNSSGDYGDSSGFTAELIHLLLGSAA